MHVTIQYHRGAHIDILIRVTYKLYCDIIC